MIKRLLPLAFLAACAPTPVLLRYEPAMPAARISMPGKPTIYVAAVDDRTSGPRMLGDGGRGKKATMAASARDSVREALTKELSRLTFSVVNVPAAADATLKAVLNNLDAEWTVGGDIPVHGKLVLDMTLVSKEGAVLWADVITGKGRAIIVGANVPGKGPDTALNGALADAMFQLGPSLSEGLGGSAPAAVASAPPPAPVPVAAPVAVELPKARASDIDSLPAARPRRPKTHALVIGVERYREKLPSADFAAGDARLAAEYFKRVLGVPEENLAVLTDDRATRGDFEKYVERWLPNRVEKDDEVIVYFSGHGAPNPKNGDSYLVPYDGDPTYLAETGYPLKRLYASLSKLGARKVTVALDSCFSGAGGRSVLAKGARPLVAVQAEKAPAGIVVLAASARDEISNSFQEQGHGLFTYYLLKGLKERGPDFRAAFDFAKPEVSRTARRQYNADQTPQWLEGK